MRAAALIFLFLTVSSLFAAETSEVVRVPAIADLNRIIREKKPKPGVYRFSGLVISVQDSLIFLLDESGCANVKFDPSESDIPRAGDVLDITVRRCMSGMPLECVRREKTGRREIPEPVEISGHDTAGWKFLYQYVRVRGVIAGSIPDELDSRFYWTVLRTPTGPVLFATDRRHYPYSRLKMLVDAEASIEGVAQHFSTWRTRLGVRINPIGDPPLSITRHAPSDIDTIPALSDTTVLHRQRTSGTVIAASSDHFYIRTDDGSCFRIQPADGNERVSVGSRVTVAGFAELDALHDLKLSEALVRTDGPDGGIAEKTSAITLNDLFTNDSRVKTVNHLFNHRIVRLSGRLIENNEGPGRRTLSDGVNTVDIDLSAFPEGELPRLVAGARVEVTGLCVGEFRHVDVSLRFPRFSGFTVIPRTPADVVVTARPPWWTSGRLLAVIGILAAVIVGVLIWNVSLRVVSERRGRELAWEQTCHAKSELKVEERTRLAVELHDSLSQTLTGVALQIETALGQKGASFGPAEKVLLTARQMLASCRQELRCCLWDLRSRTFEEQDLTEAIRRTIEPHTADAAVSVRFNVARDILSESTVHATLKIVRELVVNAIRHGHASSIRIAGEFTDGLVRFSVCDNGCGFDPASAPGARQGHFGLQGVRERTIRQGGGVTIVSTPGEGTKIVVTMKEAIA